MKPELVLLAVAFSLLGMALDARADGAFREVSFATADSGTVVANLYGSGERGVVLAHGAVFNKESWSDVADSLAARGFMALAIDFRGYGKSVAGTKEHGLYEDVLAAVRYLHEHGAKSVSVIGASMGGGASAMAATEARPGEIAHLILLSPVPIPDPEQIHAASVLYIASRDERLAPRIHEQYEKAPDPKQLVLIDGSAHAQNIFKTDQAGKLMQTLLDAAEAEVPPAQK